MSKKLLLAIGAVASIAAADAFAAEKKIVTLQRTPIQVVEFPEGYTTTTAHATLPPGCSGRHTHPGIDVGYVLEGDIILKIDGKPDQVFKAGQSFVTLPGIVHEACTDGGFKIMSTYVMERGKPLATQVPQ